MEFLKSPLCLMILFASFAAAICISTYFKKDNIQSEKSSFNNKQSVHSFLVKREIDFSELLNKIKNESNDFLSKVMCSHSSGYREDYPWWRVDLGTLYRISRVHIFNRAEGFHESLHDIEIRIGDEDIKKNHQKNTYQVFTGNKLCVKIYGELLPGENVFRCEDGDLTGRFVSVQISERNSRWHQGNVLSLCEVEVYSRNSMNNLALKKLTAQSHKDWEESSNLAVDGILAVQNYAPQVEDSCLDIDEEYYDVFSFQPTDCSAIAKRGKLLSGIYIVYPKEDSEKEEVPMEVFCDMTDGQGWTVIQRRKFYLESNITFQQPSEKFNKTIGNLCQEFWLGAENLNILTSQKSRKAELKIEILDSYGEHSFALYEQFEVTDINHSFKVKVSGYSGNAGNYLSNKIFTSIPNQNNSGGWWWQAFGYGPHKFWGANPNGDLWQGRAIDNPITWGCQRCEQRENYFIHKMEMKIRHVDVIHDSDNFE